MPCVFFAITLGHGERDSGSAADTHALTSTWRATDGYRMPGGRARVRALDRYASTSSAESGESAA